MSEENSASRKLHPGQILWIQNGDLERLPNHGPEEKAVNGARLRNMEGK